jgi:hypothetical protein
MAGKYDLGGLLKTLEKTKKSDKNSEDKSATIKFTLDKDQESAEYIIRFLPNPDSVDGSPWVTRHAHMFNFPNKNFTYEPCPQKHGKGKCYYCEAKNEHYASGDEKRIAIGGKQFAKARYFFNVLVIKDPREGGKNEGKIFVFEGGDQIIKKCEAFLKNTEIEAEERLFFHPTLGTNFKLVMTWKQDYQNYEESTFSRKASAIEIDGQKQSLEEAEEYLEKNTFKLNEMLLKDESFKSYDILKSQYLNQGASKKTESAKKPAKSEEEVEAKLPDDDDINPDFLKPTPKTAPVASAPKTASKPAPKQKVADDDDIPFKKASDDEDADLAKLLED